jgi:hypothetical protein
VASLQRRGIPCRRLRIDGSRSFRVPNERFAWAHYGYLQSMASTAPKCTRICHFQNGLPRVGKAWLLSSSDSVVHRYFTATGKIKLESQWINYPAVTQLGGVDSPPATR